MSAVTLAHYSRKGVWKFAQNIGGREANFEFEFVALVSVGVLESSSRVSCCLWFRARPLLRSQLCLMFTAIEKH